MKIIFNKKNWYCYFCGLKIKEKYFLFSMNDTTDRVFLCCASCLPKIAITNENIIREVKET